MQIEKSLLYQRILFVAFWIRATFHFFSEEIVPGLSFMKLTVDLLFDGVIVFLGVVALRRKVDIFMLIGFVLVSWFISCEYNNLSFIFFANGLREFISFLFVIPIFRYLFANDFRKERFIKSFDKQLFYFLIIQAICIIWQFLKYKAGDHGGGSLGNYYSGTISMLIYLISFYLMQKRIDTKKYFSSLWDNKIYIILLFPTFLNETKISFVLFILYFVLLLPIDRKLFIRILVFTPVVGLFILFLGYIYLVSTNGQFEDILSGDNLEAYFMSEDTNLAEAEGGAMWEITDNAGFADVPRATKLLLLPELDDENPGHVITGFGLGHFKGNNTIKNSKFATEYDWLLMGSIPYLFHLIIQLGVVGIIWFILFWIVNVAFVPHGCKRNTGLQLFLILTMLLILFYNDVFRNSFFGILFFFLIQISWNKKDENKEECTLTEELSKSNLDVETTVDA
jgi:hypothetical protein